MISCHSASQRTSLDCQVEITAQMPPLPPKAKAPAPKASAGETLRSAIRSAKHMEIRGNPWKSMDIHRVKHVKSMMESSTVAFGRSFRLEGAVRIAHIYHTSPGATWPAGSSLPGKFIAFVHVSTMTSHKPINLTRYSMARYDKCSDWNTEEQQIQRFHIISRPHPDPARPWAGRSWNSWKLGARLAEPCSSQTRPGPILDHQGHFLISIIGFDRRNSLLHLIEKIDFSEMWNDHGYDHGWKEDMELTVTIVIYVGAYGLSDNASLRPFK